MTILKKIKKGGITGAFAVLFYGLSIAALNAQGPPRNEFCGCQCPTPVSGEPTTYPNYSFSWQVPMGKECCPTSNATVPVTGVVQFSPGGTQYQMVYWNNNIFFCCTSGPIA